jgi:signal transduction histidine kinase
MRILPPADGGSVILLVNPQMLDDVLLFAPMPMSQAAPEMQANDASYEIMDRSMGLTPRTYILSPPMSGADYFLRIASAGSISLNVSAQSADDAMRTVNLVHFVQFIYVSFMILLLVWALRGFMLFKEPVLLIFLPLISLWIVHNLFSFGYLSVILSSYDAEKLGFIFRCIALILSLIVFLFHRTLLNLFQLSNRAKLLINSHLLAILMLTVIFIFYDKNIALKANAYLIAISPITFFIAAATARHDAFIRLNIVKIFYLLLSFFNVFWAAQLLGFNTEFIGSYNGVLAYGVVTSFLIFLILSKYNSEAARVVIANREKLDKLHQAELIEFEKRNSMIGFIDMLTHETKNALSVISMTVSAANLGEDRQNRIHRAISGLNKVIERCDQSVRLYNIDEQLKIQKCQVSDILNEIYADQIEKSRVTINMISQPTVLGDPVFLGVILSNLLENALKYSPAGSKVTVTLDARQGEGILVFENERGSAGMPNSEMVFKRHYRSEGAQGVAGSGLGLYICASLVRAQNGNISYRPKENRIRFIVSFPCAI